MSGVGIDFGHNESSDGPNDFGEKLAEVFSLFELFVNDGENTGGFFLQDAEEKGRNRLARGEAKDVEHVGFGDFVPTEGDKLVEHGLGVAHTAIGSFGNGPGGGVIEFDSLLGGDVLEVACDDVGRNWAEVKALAARDDGGEDFVGFGGRENEFHVFRWFLKCLKKSVESAGGEHVNLIDIDNAEPAGGGRKSDRFKEGADFINLVVGSSVDFEDIERAAFGDFDAEGIIGVEVDRGPFGTIEGFGKNSGGRGFSGAAGADEEISVGESILLDGIAEGSDHMILSKNVGKSAGAVFSGKNLVAHEVDCSEE